jgi:hypothetical protein
MNVKGLALQACLRLRSRAAEIISEEMSISNETNPSPHRESRAIAGMIVRFTPERTSDLRRFIAQ